MMGKDEISMFCVCSYFRDYSSLLSHEMLCLNKKAHSRCLSAIFHPSTFDISYMIVLTSVIVGIRIPSMLTRYTHVQSLKIAERAEA